MFSLFLAACTSTSTDEDGAGGVSGGADVGAGEVTTGSAMPMGKTCGPSVWLLYVDRP